MRRALPIEGCGKSPSPAISFDVSIIMTRFFIESTRAISRIAVVLPTPGRPKSKIDFCCSKRSRIILTVPNTARPIRHVKPITLPRRLRKELILWRVFSIPARLSPLNLPNRLSVISKSCQTIVLYERYSDPSKNLASGRRPISKTTSVKDAFCGWFSNEDLIKSYYQVKKELENYSSELIKKKELIVFNKIDLVDEDILKKKLEEFSKNKKCEIFTCFNQNEKSSLISFCNTIETPDGGSHENGFKNGVLKAIKLYGQKNQIAKISNISINDLSDYSDIVISIFINEPSFEGQTKKRIIMPKLQKHLENLIQNEFLLWLNSNKKIAKTLLETLIERSLLRTDLTKIKELERKSIKERNKLPGKLVDCSSKGIEGTELFIVEGDSAGGSAKQARDRELQAILPLRGKILNVFSVSLSKIADNNEIQNLIQSLGCGIGKNFDLAKLRYEKVILMTDADVDGSHIATLLITFIYKYMRPIIDNNRLFLAMPPLFKIQHKEKIFYAYDENEKDKIIKSEFKKIIPTLSRYKGLGEMPADQLKSTTMNPEKRKLLNVNIKQGKKELKETEKLFESLMGKKAEYRFKFIQENANFTNQIDI